MGRRHKSESLGNFFLELFDLGLREFDDSSATFANDVIVVTLVLEFFKSRLPVGKVSLFR
jgi:hypothetical protein